VTSECDLESAAHHGAVHGRDHRDVRRFVAVEEQSILFFLRRTAELADVGAGEERAAFTQQQDAAHVLALLNLLQRLLQARPHRGGNGVDRRIVDDD
jgi:hypothetical protein